MVPGDNELTGRSRVYQYVVNQWVAFNDLVGTVGSSFGASVSLGELYIAVGAPMISRSDTQNVGQVVVHHFV